MTISELLWHVHRLKKQLQEEKEAIEEHHRKMKTSMKRRGS